MAELSNEDRRAIEIWTGPLSEDEVVTAIERLAVLDNATVTAYEFLRVKHAALLAQPDELRIEGDARVRWVEAKKQIEAQLGNCLETVRAQGASLNAAASALVSPMLDQAGGRSIRAFKYTAPNPRP